MSFTMKRIAFIFICIFGGALFQGYAPVGYLQKKYKTVAEKTRLFDKVGCRYTHKVKLQNKNLLSSHKKSEYYTLHKEIVDKYTKKYAESIKHQKNAPVYLKWISDVVGYGVFAEQDIKSGDFIGEYSGMLRLVKESGDNVDYAWYYTLDTLDGKQLVIDAKEQGNELRFINHAKTPNTFRVDALGDDDVFHVCYVAQDNIAKDQQLTVSYGDGYWQSRGIEPEAI